jgi:hypothetical protein
MKFISKENLEYIKVNYLTNNYYTFVNGMKIKNENNLMDNFLKNSKTISAIEQMPTQWIDQIACYYCDKNKNSNILNSLFRTKNGSVYFQLINPELDF